MAAAGGAGAALGSPFGGAGGGLGMGMGGAGAGAVATALNPVEAQRAVAVIEVALDKLAFLSTIEPDVLAHKDELSHAVGDEVARVLRHQHELEARFRELLAQRAALKGQMNARTKAAPITRELKSISEALQENTKTLSRNLKDNPRIGDNLRKLVAERDTLYSLLASTVEELQEAASRGHFSSLARFVQAEREARERLEALREEEKQVVARVEKLEEEMLAERSAHADEMKAKQAQIDDIKTRLRKLKVSTSTVARGARREAAARTEGVARSFRLEEAALEAELDELRTHKVMEDSAHKQTVEFLNASYARLVELQKDVAAKSDLSKKDEELNRLRIERAALQEELDALRRRFEEELATEALDHATRRRREEEARLAAEEVARRREAATAIQRVLYPCFEMVMARMPPPKKKKKK